MKKVFTTMLRSLALTAFCSGAAHAQASYQLVWSDEFETTISPDWKFETGGGGWGNNEKQYYQRSNATVVDGNLLITAKKETVGGMPYTSSRMITKGSKEFTFGKIEARIKTPLGQGLWPAFWMLGGNISSVNWPRCGEIDIMEQVNAISEVHGTAHWHNPAISGGGGRAQYGGKTTVSSNTYHVYGIEWDASAIRWFVDGVQFHVMSIANGVGHTEEFQKPFFVLLNMAVAGNWPGQTVDQSKLPATMYVDYVRVYQKVTATSTKSTVKNDSEAAIQIYPNPVTDQLTVGSDVSLAGRSYRVVNALGQHVASGSIERNNTVNVASLRAGIYTLMVTAQDQQVLARRFSKQ